MAQIEKMQTRVRKIDGVHRKALGLGDGAQIKVSFGFHKIGDQEPYFFITGEISDSRSRRREDCVMCGCIHDEIRKFFPELTTLIRWHLVSQSGIPMHYEANAQYWLDMFFGRGRHKPEAHGPCPAQAFKNTVVFGAVQGDTFPEKGADVTEWLWSRFESLRDQFNTDLDLFGVEYCR